ncbi:MAG: hypothetical protein KAI64_03535 [Thermoplasmata archaeon]|nr:hypothetical protein [Thermoplasmata archaeon]
MKRLDRQEKKFLELSKKLEDVIKRESITLAALGLPKRPKKGNRGVIDNIHKSIIQMEEYLLATSGRIENVLKALKTHRQFLMRLNKRVYKSDMKERIRMEIEVMKNTLSILAMNGVDFDASILKELDSLKSSIDDKKTEISELKKRKEKIDNKFNIELKRFDLESIYSTKKILTGYM